MTKRVRMVNGTGIAKRALAFLSVEWEHHLGVAQHSEVAFVGGDDDLPPLLNLIQVANHRRGDVRRIEVVLRLIDDQRV